MRKELVPSVTERGGRRRACPTRTDGYGSSEAPMWASEEMNLSVERACERLLEPASSWRLLWRRMLGQLAGHGDDDYSQMTPWPEALVPLRNVENGPFEHFPARMAGLADSGGPSLHF